MADAAETVKDAPAELGKGLGHKLGPLPVWAWIVGGVLGAAAVYYLVVGRKGGAPSFPSLGAMGGGGLAAGSGGGGTSSTNTPTDPVVTGATAGEIQTALAAVATSLGVPFSEVQLYWQEYMQGTSPVGNAFAGGRFANIIGAVNTLLGSKAPAAPVSQGPNSNPFSNNQTWLAQILGYLPDGTTPGIVSEITAIVNGTGTTLSEAAYRALTQAQNIVGGAPSSLVYTITSRYPDGGINPPIVPPIVSAPTAPSLSLQDILGWENGYFSGAAQNFATWIQDAPSVLTHNLDWGQLQTVFNYFNAASANGIKITPQQAQTTLNGILADPTRLTQLESRNGVRA